MNRLSSESQKKWLKNMDEEASRFNLFPVFALLAMVIVGAVALQSTIRVNPITFSQHAMTSHAYAVSDIDNCFSGGGSKSHYFHDPNTDRWMQYCMDNGGGKYNFFRVFECQNGERVVVTQFKQAANKLLRYLNGGGGNSYRPVDGTPPCS